MSERAILGKAGAKGNNDKNQEEVFYESGTGICQSGPTATGADEPLPDAQTGRQRSG